MCALVRFIVCIGLLSWSTICAADAPRARAVIIGVNQVDQAHYGSPLTLKGCINDAYGVEAIVKQIGVYESSTVLLDQHATVENVTDAIVKAADELPSGSLFLLSIASHGSQLEDLNGDERELNSFDSLDEVWLLYDRMWVDDERGALWKRFKPGVRIVVIADTCHSGTSHRSPFSGGGTGSSINNVNLGSGSEMQQLLWRLPSSSVQLIEQSKSLSDDAVYLGELRMASSRQSLKGVDDQSTAIARGEDYSIGTVTRVIADLTRNVRSIDRRDAVAVYSRNKAVYDPILQSSELASGERSAMAASLILLAACQDFQTAADGSNNGAFTGTLLSLWHGGFTGSYQQFLEEIKRRMYTQYDQIPNYLYSGAHDPEFELQAGLPFKP